MQAGVELMPLLCVRDHEERVVFSASQIHVHVIDVIKAELLAILLGVKLAAKKNLKIETVDSDCFLTIKEVQKQHESSFEWYEIVRNIILFFDNYDVHCFQHVNMMPICWYIEWLNIGFLLGFISPT